MSIKWNPEVSAGHVFVGSAFLIPLLVAIITTVAFVKDIQKDVALNAAGIEIANSEQDKFRADVVYELRQLNGRVEETNRAISALVEKLARLEERTNHKK